MPISGLLGLQNFTTHPKIEPAFVEFVKHDNTYSLKFKDSEESVAVIESKESTVTRVGTVGVIGSTKCPSDKECTTDKFSINAPKEMEIQEAVDELYEDNNVLVGRLGFEGYVSVAPPIQEPSMC